MKDFAIYTGLRVALFVGCYAVVALLWYLILGSDSGYLIWPFVIAALLSSFLSLKLLAGPRERFAARVEARAARVSGKISEVRAREDADADPPAARQDA